ncbi:MAG: ribosome maturation factor RimP [Pseudomonadota bacterium]
MLFDLRQSLIELADGVLGGLSLELVDLELEFSGSRRCLRFFVDRPEGGVTIAECASASRAIGWEIEEKAAMQGAYILEVSSPGIDRRIGRPRDYMRYVGRSLKLRLGDSVDGRRNFVARLESADERGIMVATNDAVMLRLDYGQVARANLVEEVVEVEGETDGNRSS